MFLDVPQACWHLRARMVGWRPELRNADHTKNYFIMVLNHPAKETWTAMEDPLMRVIHSGQCGLARCSHASCNLQGEKTTGIIDEHIDTLKHVNPKEALHANHMTEAGVYNKKCIGTIYGAAVD